MLLQWIKDSTSKLRKVFPFPARYNMRDAALGHAEHSSQHGGCNHLRNIKRTNPQNIRLRKNSRRALFPARFSLSALCDHVFHVVCLRSKKDMVRIAARRIVALVAGVKSFWYFAIRNSPSQAMREPSNSFGSLLKRNNSVTPNEIFPNKGPAFIRGTDFDLRPKPVFYWCKPYLSPSTKSTSKLPRYCGNVLVWVFEFHAFGILIKNGRIGQC